MNDGPRPAAADHRTHASRALAADGALLQVFTQTLSTGGASALFSIPL